MLLPEDDRAADGYAAAPISLRGTADGVGQCVLTAPQVPQAQRWLVNYVTVTTTGNAAPTVNVFVDTAEPANLFDGTADGRAAIAPYVPPRVLEQGQTLLIVWVGATPGAACSARLEYDVEAT